MSAPKLLTRKEIADMIGDGFSARWVARNEVRLGLHKCRVNFRTQVALYQGWRVIPLLRSRGLVS